MPSKRQRDDNSDVADALAKVTGTRKPRGQSDLPLNPATDRKLKALIAADKKRKK